MSAPVPTAMSTESSRRASLVAGLGILVLAVLAAAANFGVLERLVTPGDAGATAAAVAGEETEFRLGVVALYVAAVLDVVVAVALVVVLGPSGRVVAALAAVLRVAYATVFVVALSDLAAVLPAVGAGGAVPGDGSGDVLAGVEAFRLVWDSGYVFFGLHLVLVGYLVARSASPSRMMPWLVGALAALAGLGYLVDVIGPLLAPSYGVTFSEITFVGEVVLMIWLILRGRPSAWAHLRSRADGDGPGRQSEAPADVVVG